MTTAKPIASDRDVGVGLRRLAQVQEMHQGVWNKSAVGCFEVRGKTLGIIGYGRIGRQVGVLAEAMGLRVLFTDIEAQLPMGNNKFVESLDDLLAESDFVTLHVPATADTKNMIRAEQLARMKKGSYLINLASPDDALVDLRGGHHDVLHGSAAYTPALQRLR